MNIKNIDLAYAAGYIDGDGCFYIGFNSKRKFLANLVVVSTNRDICIWFKELFSGNISSQINLLEPKHRKMNSWRVNKIKALPLSHTLLPFLVEKKQDAEYLINFCETVDKEKKLELIQIMRHHRKTSNLVNKDLKSIYESQRNTIVPTEEDFAYLAGFIDAEGCFTIGKYKPKDKPNYVYKAILEINNSKSSVFLWILQRFGGVIHFRNLKKNNPNQRDQFIWMISARNLNNIIHRIYPYLKQKKQVCQEIINFQKTVLSGDKKSFWAHPHLQSQYQSILKIRDEICNNVKDLNKKGIN